MIASRGTGAPENDGEDDDVPLWDSIVQNKPVQATDDQSPLDRLLRVIPGKVIQ